MSYLDYSCREAGFGPCIEASDDLVADMDRVRAYYKTEWAKFPELFTPPKLKEEDALDNAAAATATQSDALEAGDAAPAVADVAAG